MPVFPKRLVTVVGILSAAALGLTACGDSSEPADPNAPAESAPAGNAGEAVELTYMHRLPDGEGMTAVADIVQRWNDENPNIQVSSTKFCLVSAFVSHFPVLIRPHS